MSQARDVAPLLRALTQHGIALRLVMDCATFYLVVAQDTVFDERIPAQMWHDATASGLHVLSEELYQQQYSAPIQQTI